MSSTSPSRAIADKVQLHTYYRSSCSGRMRIALNLKNITPTYSYVNLVKNEQNSEDYTHINPSHSVPTLIITKASGSVIKLTQSVPALEYLEEAYPNLRPLLPKDVEARATVRTLVAIISNDVQPLTNLRNLNAVHDMGGDKSAYAKKIMTAGFEAYEAIAKESAGKFSVGNEVTLADVCLVPAVWGAERFKVDFEKMPTVRGVYERLVELDEVKKAHWKKQEDTPVELRG